MIKLYVDGATSGNGKEGATGGYGFIIYCDGAAPEMRGGPITAEEGYGKITNQVAELLAAILGMKTVLANYEKELRDDWTVEVISDSAYIVNCINDGWYKAWSKNGWLNSQKKPVANRELWEDLLSLLPLADFRFTKVKGHTGVRGNEIADKLAQEGVAMAKARVEQERMAQEWSS